MRISTRRLKRRRLKLIKVRKEGATFSELQRKFGVSPNYLSKLFKGKDINKYCEHCGENGPKVLERHHPDKANNPKYTIWLCSNCHSEVSREETSQRAKQKKAEKQSILTQSLIQQKVDDKSLSMDESISQANSTPQYIELNKAQKIVLGLILGATAIDSLWGEKIRDYFQKRQEETKIKRETHNSEANANHKSSLVGRKGSVATFLGKRPIIMTPAIILEEYLGAFKIELPDARIIHIPRDRFVFE